MAPSGANADFVDVSSIPVSVIGRIDVLPDGSSALYGSDPIAGIVNIVVRDDVKGMESQAKVGGSPGGARETLAAQLFGKHWDEGNLLLAYQYRKRTSLPVSARPYASDADKTLRGGRDLSSLFSNPGNVFDPTTGQAVRGIPSGQDGQGLTFGQLSETLNRQNSVSDTELLPNVKTNSFYTSLAQRFGHFGFTVEGRSNERSMSEHYPAVETLLIVPSSNPFFIHTEGDPPNAVGYSFARDHAFGPIAASGRTKDYGGAATVSWDFAHDWSVAFTEAYHGVDLDWLGQHGVNFDALSAALALNDSKAFNPYGDGSYTDLGTLESIRQDFRWHVWSSVETETLLLQGPLFQLRGGDAKVALGVELRKDELARQETTFDGPLFNPTDKPRLEAVRNVQSEFAELTLPVWGDASNPHATPAVLVKLAGRADEYSDFGKMFTPKATVEAAFTRAVKIRGTLGRSFRAPLLTDLYDTTNNMSALQVLNDPHSDTGQSLVLIEQKNNEHLLPENARTWTLGLDLVPIPGMAISLTYYGIEYWSQVFRQGSSSVSLETILASPEWSGLVTRNPSLESVEAICHSPGFMGLPEQCAATPPAAILDVEPRNLSKTKLRGLDLIFRQSLERSVGYFELKVDASYIAKLDQDLVQGAQTVRLVNKVDNPAAVRARTELSWRRHKNEGFGAALALDYTGPYEDSVSPELQTVDGSFMTDLDLSYRSARGVSESSNLELDLSISNLLNKSPPFVDRLAGYDVANARPYGRVIGLYLTTRW
jgi:iron complex outermembrane receptor protein